jgi:3-dehydrosphinganine reductase
LALEAGAAVGIAVALVTLAALAVLGNKIRPKPLKLQGSHCLVTGGSQGIGLEMARDLLQKGAKVTIAARGQGKMDEALAELDAPGRCASVRMDVSDYASVAKAVSEAEAKFGPVDCAVCCAGKAYPAILEDQTPEECDFMARVNFLGPVHTAKAVLPGMKERRRGRILLVSSMAGQVGIYGFSVYSGSKFALAGFAQGLQMEVRPYNIRVGVAYPPDTDTPGWHEENKKKPSITKEVSGAASLVSAATVANGMSVGLERGSFCVTVGLEGFLLAILTTGFNPPTSLLKSLLELFMLPLTRIIGLALLGGWNDTVARCVRREEAQRKGE